MFLRGGPVGRTITTNRKLTENDGI